MLIGVGGQAAPTRAGTPEADYGDREAEDAECPGQGRPREPEKGDHQHGEPKCCLYIISQHTEIV